MAVSLNLVTGFNPRKLQTTYENASRSSIPKISKSTVSYSTYGSRRIVKDKRQGLSLALMAAGSNQVDTDTNDQKGFEIPDTTLSNDNSSAENRNSQPIVNNSEASVASNRAAVSLDDASPSPDAQSTKRSSLTARERLRAARVLNRYAEPKTSKTDMGNKVLQALREDDRGKKKSRLPEAPMNLFDDSKRGMPKDGWTFSFPGGSDLFFIIFSFVFISTVMFATTYIVWKVGAIHFNEY